MDYQIKSFNLAFDFHKCVDKNELNRMILKALTTFVSKRRLAKAKNMKPLAPSTIERKHKQGRPTSILEDSGYLFKHILVKIDGEAITIEAPEYFLANWKDRNILPRPAMINIVQRTAVYYLKGAVKRMGFR